MLSVNGDRCVKAFVLNRYLVLFQMDKRIPTTFIYPYRIVNEMKYVYLILSFDEEIFSSATITMRCEHKSIIALP